MERIFYVGTNTSGKSEGIYICSMDTDSGAIKLKSLTRGVINPTFLAVDQRQRYLYAVNEIAGFEGQPEGTVSAFRIDKQTGELDFLHRQPSGGASPCHLVVDKSNRFLLVANYSGRSVAVFPIQHKGSLGAPTDVVQHRGSSINPKRQQGPHPHSVILDAANRFAFVADLGTDKVMIHRFDSKRGKLTLGTKPWVQVKAGAGPRHFVFHTDGKRAYLINELDSTLMAFDYDASSGDLRETQTISTLPAGFTRENYCADVQVALSGRYIYGSNRGHDSIVVFAVDDHSGKLSAVQYQSTQGKTPRNFAIDPTGRFLLVANQNSDAIVVFAIDPETGKLMPTGHDEKIPVPVCLQFATPLT
ncbi:MAG: lactonase family protein [bacterium]